MNQLNNLTALRLYFTVVLFSAVCITNPVSAQRDSTSRYIKTPTGYLMVLRQDDDLFAELEKMALAEHIPAAQFTGMGFVNMRFGFFNAKTKTYKPAQFNNVELVSMHGTLAWKNDSVSIHAHGVVGKKNFKTRAGHILSAQVSTGSLEIAVTVYDQKLQRSKDEKIGADVLQLE